MDENLANIFYTYFGGDIYTTKQALDSLVEKKDNFNPFAVVDCPGLPSCVEDPEARAHLENIAKQGFSPVRNVKTDKGARMIAEENVGGIIKEDAITFDLPDIFTNTSCEWAVIPSSYHMRLKIADKLKSIFPSGLGLQQRSQQLSICRSLPQIVGSHCETLPELPQSDQAMNFFLHAEACPAAGWSNSGLLRVQAATGSPGCLEVYSGVGKSSLIAGVIAPGICTATLFDVAGKSKDPGVRGPALKMYSNVPEAGSSTAVPPSADQSAFDVLEGVVATKSTPDSVDLKLSNYSTTAAMNGSIASANNATLATVAANYGLKTVVDQHSLDIAARITPLEVDTKVANALLGAVTAAALASELASRDASISGLQASKADASALTAYALQSTVDTSSEDAETTSAITTALLAYYTSAQGESVSVTDLLADSLALTGSATLDGLTAQGNVGCDQLLCNDVNCTDVFTTGVDASATGALTGATLTITGAASAGPLDCESLDCTFTATSGGVSTGSVVCGDVTSSGTVSAPQLFASNTLIVTNTSDFSDDLFLTKNWAGWSKLQMSNNSAASDSGPELRLLGNQSARVFLERDGGTHQCELIMINDEADVAELQQLFDSVDLAISQFPQLPQTMLVHLRRGSHNSVWDEDAGSFAAEILQCEEDGTTDWLPWICLKYLAAFEAARMMGFGVNWLFTDEDQDILGLGGCFAPLQSLWTQGGTVPKVPPVSMLVGGRLTLRTATLMKPCVSLVQLATADAWDSGSHTRLDAVKQQVAEELKAEFMNELPEARL
ncbi:unnamed protein product [Effrenium voratum]|uniref:Uncharacterized protein n=1 Tax=Effrenium voratum TaxID=2562239 RepID=A0AA36IU04_9DINO|nr:unnamed protein product [Effrenium voratum]